MGESNTYRVVRIVIQAVFRMKNTISKRMALKTDEVKKTDLLRRSSPLKFPIFMVVPPFLIFLCTTL